jgi:hypothetical protein
MTSGAPSIRTLADEAEPVVIAHRGAFPRADAGVRR